jgi:hypothetical protein
MLSKMTDWVADGCSYVDAGMGYCTRNHKIALLNCTRLHAVAATSIALAGKSNASCSFANKHPISTP